MSLSFYFPKNSTYPTNIALSQFTGNYSESSASSWATNQDSAGSATVKIDSFTYSAADTVVSADFSFKAWGGTTGSALTTKNITGGTVRTN